MRSRYHGLKPTVQLLEARNLLSSDGFGAANVMMAQGCYANYTDPSTGLPYANYGQLHADFAQGNGIIAGCTGLGCYNSSSPNDPGLSKVDNGTMPAGQS